MPSAQDTPGPDLGSEFGEEEDVKPSVEYLDSVNEYRKRSRSVEDIGEGSGMNKIPRTANGTPEANGVPVAAVSMEVEMTTEVIVETTVSGSADDPMVHGMFVTLPFLLTAFTDFTLRSQWHPCTTVADNGRAPRDDDPRRVHCVL